MICVLVTMCSFSKRSRSIGMPSMVLRMDSASTIIVTTGSSMDTPSVSKRPPIRISTPRNRNCRFCRPSRILFSL